MPDFAGDLASGAHSRAKQMLAAALAVLASLSMTACTTMRSIESKGPSYIVDYAGVSREVLATCIVLRSDKKWAYEIRRIEGADSSAIEYYSSGVVVVGGAVIDGGAVPYFSAKIDDGRVDIFGRFSIAGDYGKNLIPIINDCASSLGGTSAERALPKKP